MREWHSQRRGLVVFDNVEQLDVVEKWRPKYGQTRVLITSRIDSRDPQWGGQGIETISVDTLPRDRSMELLLKGRQDVLNDTDEMRAANDICELLGDLPLAVHLAGAYLSYLRHAVSVREYLNELSSQPVLTNRALVAGVRDSSPTDHIQNVAATFDMSYARLDQEEETDALAARHPTWEEEAARIGAAHGPLADGILGCYRDKYRPRDEQRAHVARVVDRWGQLREEAGAIVRPLADLSAALRAAGAPVTARELGVEPAEAREVFLPGTSAPATRCWT